jgi:iron complex transport system substrate-binding protein
MKNSCLIFCFFLVFSSCQKRETGQQSGIVNTVVRNNNALADDSIYYAKGFQIETYDDYTLVTIRNPWNTHKILKRYVLVPKKLALPENLPEGILIRTPLERTVSYGSVQCSFFAEFDALPTLVGVCEPHYINIPYIQEGIAKGNIVDLGQAANPNLEKIMLIAPEVLFTAPIEEAGYGQTAKSGITTIECVDYMESSPLGRAEWIRFLALFFEKRARADSLFAETVDNYKALQALASHFEHRPTVFAETVYSGVWYVPGGNSYMAHFFQDAGADYLWKDDTHTGSIGLSFESVLEKAEKADFWLIKYNASQELTSGELIKDNPNYAFFDAFKRRNIYACNTGKVTYYEDLPVHPDCILKVLVWIFHPEVIPEYRSRYYCRVN